MGVVIGVIESMMARLRLLNVGQMLMVAAALAVIGLFWVLR